MRKKNYPLWLIFVFLVYSILCAVILMDHLRGILSPIFRFSS